MLRSGGFRWPLAGSLILVSLAVMARPSGAAEPTAEFIAALREKGYFDEAITYLEQMRTNRLAPADFVETIDYELAVTLLESSSTMAEAGERRKRLDDAKAALLKFLKEHPSHALASTARSQLAGLLVQQGRLDLDRAGQLAKDSDEGRRLREAAQAGFHEAEQVFLDAEKKAGETLKQFGFVHPRDFRKSERRDQVRRELLQARLARIWVQYEIGQALPQGSPERKTALTDAARQFGELYEQQSGRLAGYYAAVGQGRCLKDLGEVDRAFSLFEELTRVPDQPEAFFELKSKAARQALETALLPGVAKHKQALDLARRWTESAAHATAIDDDGRAIPYFAGEVARAYAMTMDSTGPQQAQREKTLQLAREYYAAVDRSSPFREKAEARLSEAALGGEAHEPATFAEARNRMKAVLDRLMATEAADDAAGTRADRVKRIAAARDEAMKYCRLAMKLRTSATPAEDVDVVRYSTAYLQLKSGDFREAAETAESLARKTAGPTAREGAKVALAACEGLFRASAGEKGHQQAGERLHALALFITKHWSDQPEADDARLVLIQAAVSDGSLDDARRYLGQIPAESPRRGEAEVSLGQAAWTEYLRAAALAGADRAPPVEAEKMLAEAEKMLDDGIRQMRKAVDAGARVSEVLAAGVLAMAQIRVAAGQAEEAARWLDDPKIGARTLVDSGRAAAEQGNFAIETYKVAIRTYVAARQGDKALRALQTLEDLVQQSGDADAGRRLTQILIDLGRQVEDQVRRWRLRGLNEALDRLLSAQETFVGQLIKSRETASFHAIDLAAETSLGVARGLDTVAGTLRMPSAEPEKNSADGTRSVPATLYYRKAADAYRGLLQRAQADKAFAPQPEAITAVQIRLARCLGRLGEHGEAIGLLQAVLRDHPAMVDAQTEAAYTYQAWGEEKPEYYELAIQGGSQAPGVWGWDALARRVQSDARFQDTFFESHYNMALCRFRWAQTKSLPDERRRLLEAAEQEIRVLERLYPDLGGDAWHNKYDELTKRIQSLLREPRKT